MTAAGEPTKTESVDFELIPITAEDRRRRRTLAAVCIVLFATMLDTTIVSVAIGDLEKHTGLSLGDFQWILNGYLVMFTAFMLAGGALADTFGRRRFMMIGLAVFATGSVICVAGGPHWLVFGRLVQGLGAGMSEPATLAVIRQEYEDPEERSRALGIWAATSGIALAVGPVLGGFLVAIDGWRAVFLFNIPLAAVCIVVGFVFVPESWDPSPPRLDIPGLALGAVAIISVSYLFIHSQAAGFASGGAAVSALLAIGCSIGFIFWQRICPAPLIPRGLLANRIVTGGLVGTLVAGFATYSVFFFGTLDLSVVGGRSAGITAAAFIPMMIAMISTAIYGGVWAAARGTAEPLAAGLLIAAIASVLSIPTLGTDPRAPVVAVVFMITGIGLGLCLAPGAAAVMGGVSAERAGLGAALVNESRMLGGLLAVALLGNITVGRLESGIASRICHPATLLCSFEPQIVHAATHGQGDSETKQIAGLRLIPSIGKLVDQALAAAYSSFASGMRVALGVCVGVLLLTAIYVYVTRNARVPQAAPVAASAGGAATAPAIAPDPIASAPTVAPVALPAAPPAAGPLGPGHPDPFAQPVTPPVAQPVAAPPPSVPPPAAAPVEPPPAPPPAPAAEPDDVWSNAERWWQEGHGG